MKDLKNEKPVLKLILVFGRAVYVQQCKHKISPHPISVKKEEKKKTNVFFRQGMEAGDAISWSLKEILGISNTENGE